MARRGLPSFSLEGFFFLLDLDPQTLQRIRRRSLAASFSSACILE